MAYVSSRNANQVPRKHGRNPSSKNSCLQAADNLRQAAWWAYYDDRAILEGRGQKSKQDKLICRRNCKAFEHRRLDQGRGDYITKMATLADSFLADLDELSDNDADIVEEDDVEAGNMEE
uniref:Uncharacterized protein n=1 Tax=Salix viminalis TaxID=40686 RepID=A0A6N2KV52_SALVM